MQVPTLTNPHTHARYDFPPPPSPHPLPLCGQVKDLSRQDPVPPPLHVALRDGALVRVEWGKPLPPPSHTPPTPSTAHSTSLLNLHSMHTPHASSISTLCANRARAHERGMHFAPSASTTASNRHGLQFCLRREPCADCTRQPPQRVHDSHARHAMSRLAAAYVRSSFAAVHPFLCMDVGGLLHGQVRVLGAHLRFADGEDILGVPLTVMPPDPDAKPVPAAPVPKPPAGRKRKAEVLVEVVDVDSGPSAVPVCPGQAAQASHVRMIT